MTNYRKSMVESLAEVRGLQEDNMDMMRKAAGGAMQTIKMKDGKLQMDSFTASAIMQVYDKVNPANQKKIAVMINKGTKAGMLKLQSFAMKQVKSEYEPQLDEAKYDLYHKDFSTAMQHAYKMAKKLYGITVDPKEIDDKVASGPRKPSSGKTNSYRLKGDKGGIQVQVYNKGGNKPYELNFYKEEVEIDENKLPDMREALRQVRTEKPIQLDEAVKHMEVPPDAARGRGVPDDHRGRIGYDSKENQQAYNSITHGSPDNQIDVAKHFMKKGLKSKALHKAVADELGVIHWEVHKQLTHDKSKLHPLHMSFEGEELDEAKYELYHKDFSTAMQHAYKMAKKLYGITVDPKEIDDKVASGPRKPSSGKTNSYRLKGDKGAIQVQVYNMDRLRSHKQLPADKKYELNMYKEEVDLDEALPSHLKKFFDKDGNPKSKEGKAAWERLAKMKGFKKYTSKQVKMAIGIAFDKRYVQGNMTGAVNAIEKIAKGLSEIEPVRNALRRANENTILDRIDRKLKERKELHEASNRWELGGKKFSLVNDKGTWILVTQGTGTEKKLKARTQQQATAELVKKGYRES